MKLSIRQNWNKLSWGQKYIIGPGVAGSLILASIAVSRALNLS